MSERAATMLQDDLEAMGPTKRSDVEQAQQKIIAVCGKLGLGLTWHCLLGLT